MGVSSGVDGAPDGFGWTEALLASAVVLVPLTSRTLFQAVLVVFSKVAGNNCGCAANVLPGHQVENDPRQEGGEVLACCQAAGVQRDCSVEDVCQVVQRPLK